MRRSHKNKNNEKLTNNYEKKLGLDSKYLDNPIFLSGERSDSYQYLSDDLENKLASWKFHCLSWTERATAINSVLSSLPNYTIMRQ